MILVKIFRNFQSKKICPQFRKLRFSTIFCNNFSDTSSKTLFFPPNDALDTSYIQFCVELIENIIDRKNNIVGENSENLTQTQFISFVTQSG